MAFNGESIMLVFPIKTSTTLMWWVYTYAFDITVAKEYKYVLALYYEFIIDILAFIE